MKRLLFLFAISLFAATAWNASKAQNYDYSIDFYVPEDSTATVKIKGSLPNTTVNIFGGLQNYDITIGTDWTTLNLSDPDVEIITLSGNIVAVHCSNNRGKLDSIDVSKNELLRELYCDNNDFTELNVTNNTYLEILHCKNNLISALNLKNKRHLNHLICNDNELRSLDISNCQELKELYCYENKLTELNVNSCTALTKLHCYKNQLTELNVNSCTALTKLHCYKNQLTELNVSPCTELVSLHCYENKLPMLDIRNNTKLEHLYCFKNNFSTEAVDALYCWLSNRNGKTAGKIIPAAYTSTLPDNLAVLASNKTNATNKNWEVRYWNDTEISTSGTYVCGTPNMNRYITLTVRAGEQISLDLMGELPNTSVLIKSGTYNKTITIDDDWSDFNEYLAQNETMTIYGNLAGFDCSDNYNDVTEIDLNHNVKLKRLYCNNVAITSLDISQITNLDFLSCYNTNLSTSDWDAIYCALPNRNGKEAGLIQAASSSTPLSDLATIQATNKTNANAKNWKVQNTTNSTEISTVGTYTCGTPNMNHYIKLFVDEGNINLRLKSDVPNTKVRIVSGTNTRDITIDNEYWQDVTFSSVDGLITIYGNVTEIDCGRVVSVDLSHNTELKAVDCSDAFLNYLDVSKNKELKSLQCYDNNFSTTDWDALFCSLPDRNGKEAGVIYPVYNSTSSTLAEMQAANKTNATAKNWKVRFSSSEEDITTTGNYACGMPNMNSYIALKVEKDNETALKLRAFIPNTPIRIVSGSIVKDTVINDEFTDLRVHSASTDISIYGNIAGFNCSRNSNILKTLDVSNNTRLEELNCSHNQLTKLDVSKNINLTGLDCSNNQLKKLDTGNLLKLRILNCSNNQFTELDVTNNRNLTTLLCSNNQLTDLNISFNTELKKLFCTKNRLGSLDISRNTKLDQLYCFGNNFSTGDWDAIFCSMPDRSDTWTGKLYPASDASSPELNILKATNKANATAKNWNLYYRDPENTPIPNNLFTGNYACGTPNLDRYITITSIKDGEKIEFYLTGDIFNTPIRIVSGSLVKDTIITPPDEEFPGLIKFPAINNAINIYGNIAYFDTGENKNKVSNIDFSHNKELKKIYCSDMGDSFTSLDVSKNTELKELICSYNGLTELNLDNNKDLVYLNCSYNRLRDLNISNNPKLKYLDCSHNSLTSLDISRNTEVQTLKCSDNIFSTATLDAVYCALPNRTEEEAGLIIPIFDATSSELVFKTVTATNKANATTKNWKVKYDQTEEEVPTSGSYVCGTTNMKRYITLTVKQGEQISLDLKGDIPNTPVRIVSGLYVKDMVIGNEWTDFINYPAVNETMTIYGDIAEFDCSENYDNITALDASQNKELKVLLCYNNELKTLSINHYLRELDCSYNQITSLDLDDCWNLINLNCSNNRLTGLDITDNSSLKELNCSNNQLKALYLSKKIALTELSCYNNNFSTAALDAIYCALPDRTGQEESLIFPVYNGASENHDIVTATHKANATAKNWKVKYAANGIEVPTSGNYSCGTLNTDRYITLTVKPGKEIAFQMKADFSDTPIRIVNGTLIKDTIIGTDWDEYNKPAQTDIITIYGNIRHFFCPGNDSNLIAIDVSRNTELRNLDCYQNAISTLDITNNVLLTDLDCGSNKLTKLNLSNNKMLTKLDCSGNKLTSLNINNNMVLESLNCSNNPLTRLDLSNNKALNSLTCDYTETLSQINVSKCTGLRFMSCVNNHLTELDLTQNTELHSLYCSDNQITTLDVSRNKNLTNLDCSKNKLTWLDISKNKNLKSFRCYDNYLSTSSLNAIYCALPDAMGEPEKRVIVPVHNPASSNHATVLATNKANATAKNWTVKYYAQHAGELITTGSYACGMPMPNMDRYITINFVPGEDYEDIVLDLACDEENTPVQIVSGKYATDTIIGKDWISSYFLYGSNTMTIYGNISEFTCSENNGHITAVDVSHNLQLKRLDCEDNQIASLDISKNTELTELFCSDNRLTALDVSNNTELTDLWCYKNQLTSLDIKNNTELASLRCYDNNFSTETLDDIYCALPDRTGKEAGDIQPVMNASSSNHNTVLATNKANAAAKNWRVKYFESNADIPDNLFTGTHVCMITGTKDVPETEMYIYPNPVRDLLHVSATDRIERIEIYNLLGNKVAETVNTEKINLSYLPAGVYSVRLITLQGNRTHRIIKK